MPQIDEKGSTSVEGGMDINIIADKPNHRGVHFTENGIMLEGVSGYVIEEGANDANIHKLEGGFETDAGLFEKRVKVRPENS